MHTNKYELCMNDEKRKRSVIVSRFVIRASSFISLVAQRFDGIEGGGFACGIKAKENADGCAEQKGEDYGADRNQRGPMCVNRQNGGGANAAENPNSAAD